MTITIRKMTISDLPEVVEIDQMSFSLPWPVNSFRYEVSDNRTARCMVAETEDHRIAAMIVSWILVDEMHIATFATHRDFRRQGIGSALLIAALNEARLAGAKRAFLEVRTGNGLALEVYKKFGFEVTGRRKAYYRDNGEDAILMTLEQMEAA
jgi:ribosomal-protein-alanine N-acetyltransferase